MKAEWDDFVGASKNGTFLFDRNYMDYHAERFADHSLMFYLKGRLYAVLPANVRDGVMYSHQGLTYGGLITGTAARAAAVCSLFDELNAYLRRQGVTKVVYKPVPWVYASYAAEEDLYAIVKVCRARLVARDISSTIFCLDGRMLGGVVVYLNRRTVHTQYISASPEGKDIGALDMLFDELVNSVFADYEYFDFGRSTEDGGRYLNENLIFQKEGFGGRGVCYDTYEWEI